MAKDLSQITTSLLHFYFFPFFLVLNHITTSLLFKDQYHIYYLWLSVWPPVR